jgi:hypothetical protein
VSELLDVRVMAAPKAAEQPVARLAALLEVDRAHGPYPSRHSPGLVRYYLTGPPPSPLCGGEWAEVTAPKVAGCGCAYRPRRAGRDNLLYTLKGRADRPARHLRRNAACHGPARRFTQLG